MNWALIAIVSLLLLIIVGSLGLASLYCVKHQDRISAWFKNQLDLPREWTPRGKAMASLALTGCLSVLGFFGAKCSALLDVSPWLFVSLASVMWLVGTATMLAPRKLRDAVTKKLESGSLEKLVRMYALSLLALMAFATLMGIAHIIVVVIQRLW
ncbi:MAG: hypothetical protein AB1603_02970 [Chloroflexota bacterium]